MQGCHNSGKMMRRGIVPLEVVHSNELQLSAQVHTPFRRDPSTAKAMDDKELLNYSSCGFEKVLANAALDLQASFPWALPVVQVFVPGRD